jgi:hypothetical protein
LRRCPMILVMALLVTGSPAFGAGTAASAATTLANPSFESVRTGAPQCWTTRATGSAKRSLTASSAARTGAAAALLSVSGWSSGDVLAMTDRAAGCAPTGTAGHSYRFSVWVRSDRPYFLVGHYRDAAGTWRRWTAGLRLAATSGWTAATLETPALPPGATTVSFGAGLSRTGKVFMDDATLRDLGGGAAETPGQPSAAPLLADSFDTADGLLTNEFAYWNPQSTSAARSPIWEMTSGSLFSRGSTGWTGAPDDRTPDATSTSGTNSAIFRLNTRRRDFGDVDVSFRLNIQRLVSTVATPAVDWDGVHVWVRYQSEEQLYYASVARRDGAVLVKKKCPGGYSNGGTYYTLGNTASGVPIPFGTARDITVTVRNNADGSVTVSAFIDGRLVTKATDTGVGCAPIRAAGATGIRGDNAEFSFDDFEVTAQ